MVRSRGQRTTRCTPPSSRWEGSRGHAGRVSPAQGRPPRQGDGVPLVRGRCRRTRSFAVAAFEESGTTTSRLRRLAATQARRRGPRVVAVTTFCRRLPRSCTVDGVPCTPSKTWGEWIQDKTCQESQPGQGEEGRAPLASGWRSVRKTGSILDYRTREPSTDFVREVGGTRVRPLRRPTCQRSGALGLGGASVEEPPHEP